MKIKILKGLFCFIPTIIGVLLWNKLPNRLAIHFGIYGADTFGSRLFVVFFAPFIFFLIHTVYILILEKFPEWLSHSKKKNYSYMIPIVSVVFFLLSIINS